MRKPDEFKTKDHNSDSLKTENLSAVLRHTKVWVNEQFPPEIEERRKKLYPVLRVARQNYIHFRFVIDKFHNWGSVSNEMITLARGS